MATTKNATKSTAAAIEAIPEGTPQLLTEAPVFKPRKAKSALRLAIESLEVGQALASGFVLAPVVGTAQEQEAIEKANKNILSKVRQRTQQIQNDEDFAGRKFSTRVDVESRVIVTRLNDIVPGEDAGDDDEDADD